MIKALKTVLNDAMEYCSTLLILMVDVSTVFNEHLDESKIVALSSDEQRTVEVAIKHIGIRSSFQQKSDEIVRQESAGYD